MTPTQKGEPIEIIHKVRCVYCAGNTTPNTCKQCGSVTTKEEASRALKRQKEWLTMNLPTA